LITLSFNTLALSVGSAILDSLAKSTWLAGAGNCAFCVITSAVFNVCSNIEGRKKDGGIFIYLFFVSNFSRTDPANMNAKKLLETSLRLAHTEIRA
jgi:hypothetical protein